jgi:aminopeptidase-like protein/aminoglycoside N3'-acetyltransferase
MPPSINLTYCREDLVSSLKRVGLRSGDVVFVEASGDSLGELAGGSSAELQWELYYSAMREVVGMDGTLLVPAFSLSFERNEEFDPDKTRSVQGASSSSREFIEYFRTLPGAVRSADPNYSVAGLGPRAKELLCDLPNTSFGQGCFYERLLKASGKLCGIGVDLGVTPFLQYVDETARVPFRYKRLFTGRIFQNGSSKKAGWIASVPIESANALRDGSRIEHIAHGEGLRVIELAGLGQVYAIECGQLFDLALREVARDPWATARGPAADPIELEKARVGSNGFVVGLSKDAPIVELIAKLWKLPRDIVSDGYDAALLALSTQAPMVLHEYPTGTECWTWLVPEKWTCHEAWLETIDGRRLISYEDNPLHVVSYSLPVDGEVSRDELFNHLHVHPVLSDAIPFIFKYYERDWGLCCSRELKESLADEKYRIRIRSSFSYGILKVGEVVVRGRSSKSFVLCAHLCHPAMVNDDLSGVVVGLKVMQELLKRKNLRYTYRFLILPETIGSVAYLSHHEQLIPDMIGGLFLEMMGLENPHALQLSFAGDTEVDRVLSQVLQEVSPDSWTGPFRTIVGNDERQFNAPGVRVPMLSLSRVTREKNSNWPYYPEYHSSRDTPDLAPPRQLAESRDLVLRMIDAIEGNQVPVNKFRGEIFCSRFGLNRDAYTDPEGNRALFDMIFLIDGTRSVKEIAGICNISLESAQGVLEMLRQRGLVEYTGA